KKGQGISDIRDHQGDPTPPYPDLVALVESASVLSWIGPERAMPPVFIAHGDMDTVVPKKQSERLHAALVDAGADCEYVLVPGAGHNDLGDETDALATAFLLGRLRGCAADLNHDGSADLFDFLAYVNLFNAHDPEADLTGDGALDLFDYLAFVNLFN